MWKAFFKDISTALREGGPGSSFSSKRICGTALIVVGLILLFPATGKFPQLVSAGWPAVLIFVPTLLCFVTAAVFFYINGTIDIKSALDKAEDIAESAGGKLK